MRPTDEQARTKRVELILEQIDALPTLPSIAARLLKVSSAADADFRQIVSLIESDPALTAKLLGLCRQADRARADEISTVDRAVVFLGFEAVRAAALSVNIVQALADPPRKPADEEPAAGAPALDRRAFWRYSIGVACAAETIAREHRHDGRMPKPTEAFVCGLLHGIGILALDYALPRAYAKVLEAAGRTGMDLARLERTVLGLDHHTAGRRLAERWSLPRVLHDVIWLAGVPYDSLPDLPHKRTIALVNVAAAVTRRLHVGRTGDPSTPPDPAALCRQAGLDASKLAPLTRGLYDQVAERAADLGVDEPQREELLFDSIAQANRELERLRASGAQRDGAAERLQKALGEVARFASQPWGAEPGALNTRAPSSLAQACEAVGRSAAAALGAGASMLLRQEQAGGPIEVRPFTAQGRPGAMLTVGPAEIPAAARSLCASLSAAGFNGPADAHAPWLARLASAGTKALRLIPIEPAAPGESSAGPVWALAHDREPDASLGRPALAALVSSWRFALAAGERAEEGRRLRETIERSAAQAEAMREVVEQARERAFAVDFALGVAGEMQRPLEVIRGRAELLGEQIDSQKGQRSVESIQAAVERLERVFGVMRLMLRPPEANRAPHEVATMLGLAMRDASEKIRSDPKQPLLPRIKVAPDDGLPKVGVDGEQCREAFRELFLNALEAPEVRNIEVRAQHAESDSRIVVTVKDDGPGMPDEDLARAFEPFAFQKRSTPRRGMGLVRARRLLGLSGGTLELARGPAGGLVATVTLRVAGAEDEAPAEPGSQEDGGAERTRHAA